MVLSVQLVYLNFLLETMFQTKAVAKYPTYVPNWNESCAGHTMSDLYRSAISARIAKLPDLPQADDDDDESEEAADSIGLLPGNGMGPPAMQVELS